LLVENLPVAIQALPVTIQAFLFISLELKLVGLKSFLTFDVKQLLLCTFASDLLKLHNIFFKSFLIIFIDLLLIETPISVFD
jgi:hypothetical protein